MLKLRKILLLDIIYIIFFILVIIISIIRINLPKKSNYSFDDTELTGNIVDMHVFENQYKMIIKGKEKVMVNYYPKEKMELNLGDKIKVTGEFTKPNSNKNKHLFNYKKYLERKNIYFIVKSNYIKKISANKNPYYYIKNLIIKHLDNNPYLNTFIMGDKSYINRNVIRSYQENGISHLFALSGMHITLLVSLISKFLKNFNIPEEDIFKYTSIILFVYLLLVGFSPSILRGVLFYVLFPLIESIIFILKKSIYFYLLYQFHCLLIRTLFLI